MRESAEPLRFDGKYFWLAEDARGEAEAHFRRWYTRAGRDWLSTRTTALARKTGTSASRIEVRDLGFRWGSCGKHGVVLFNWRLLQLPVRLIDYIIVHELVHLLTPTHGKVFKSFMYAYLPDWEEREQRLNASVTRQTDNPRFLPYL